jgi:hypothetical protein
MHLPRPWPRLTGIHSLAGSLLLRPTNFSSLQVVLATRYSRMSGLGLFTDLIASFTDLSTTQHPPTSFTIQGSVPPTFIGAAAFDIEPFRNRTTALVNSPRCML